MRKITMGDIARKTGVSNTCVSFVYNGKAKERRISAEVIETVTAALTAAGFQVGIRALSPTLLQEAETWRQALEKIADGHPDPITLAMVALHGPFSINTEKTIDDTDDQKINTYPG